VPYYLLTVTASRRTNLGLQVEPAVRIRELASRVKDTDVPMPGDWYQADPDAVDTTVTDR
jgi:hypothetical protein